MKVHGVPGRRSSSIRVARREGTSTHGIGEQASFHRAAQETVVSSLCCRETGGAADACALSLLIWGENTAGKAGSKQLCSGRSALGVTLCFALLRCYVTIEIFGYSQTHLVELRILVGLWTMNCLKNLNTTSLLGSFKTENEYIMSPRPSSSRHP